MVDTNEIARGGVINRAGNTTADNGCWLHRNQLKLGMFVKSIDRPWSGTGFSESGFVIDSRKSLADIQDACEYACVDSLR